MDQRAQWNSRGLLQHEVLVFIISCFAGRLPVGNEFMIFVYRIFQKPHKWVEPLENNGQVNQQRIHAVVLPYVDLFVGFDLFKVFGGMVLPVQENHPEKAERMAFVYDYKTGKQLYNGQELINKSIEVTRKLKGKT